jgi:undecaprenyl-diphosphatase
VWHSFPLLYWDFLLNDFIDTMLGSVTVVAVSLLVGGIFLLFVDRIFNKVEQHEITYKNGFIIGLFPVLGNDPWGFDALRPASLAAWR